MTRSVQVPLFVLAAVVATPAAIGVEFSPTTDDRSGVTKSPTEVPAPRTTATSSTVLAMLADVAPHYTPPAKASETVAVEEPHETEKPRNGIIRLPRYLVQETKPPTFKERELLTHRGGLDLAYQRHPGLRLGSLGPLNNNVWAQAMLDEEWGIERAKEMFELLGFVPGAHPRPIFVGRPSFGLPLAASGPWAGMVVPWERK